MKDRATQRMIAGNRSGERLPVEADAGWVELRLGLRYLRLPLVDIHEGGLGFEWPDGMPEFVAGSTLTEALVRVAGREIRGKLVIRHVTTSISMGTLCGARFDPATEADGVRLLELVNEMRTQSGSPVRQSHGTMLRPAGSRSAARLQCPYCLAELEHAGPSEEAVCPYCLQALASV